MTYELSGLAEEFADEGYNVFSLSEFFRAAKNEANAAYEFESPNRVSAFLQLVRGRNREHQKAQLTIDNDTAPYPFEGRDYGDSVMHTVWYLPDVAACHAMGDLLTSEPGVHSTRCCGRSWVVGGSWSQGAQAGSGSHP